MIFPLVSDSVILFLWGMLFIIYWLSYVCLRGRLKEHKVTSSKQMIFMFLLLLVNSYVLYFAYANLMILTLGANFLIIMLTLSGIIHHFAMIIHEQGADNIWYSIFHHEITHVSYFLIFFYLFINGGLTLLLRNNDVVFQIGTMVLMLASAIVSFWGIFFGLKGKYPYNLDVIDLYRYKKK